MDKNELKALHRKIKIYNVLNILFWAVNIVLIVVPFVHYYRAGFNFDMYFAIVTAANIIAFWGSYKILDTLSYYKNRYRHFSEKITSHSN